MSSIVSKIDAIALLMELRDSALAAGRQTEADRIESIITFILERG